MTSEGGRAHRFSIWYGSFEVMAGHTHILFTDNGKTVSGYVEQVVRIERDVLCLPK